MPGQGEKGEFSLGVAGSLSPGGGVGPFPVGGARLVFSRVVEAGHLDLYDVSIRLVKCVP